MSDACEPLLGYVSRELIGTQITQYMHPDDLAATRDSIVRVMDGKPHVDFRNRYSRKEGGIVHILWSARWYEDEGVRIGVARNVTALMQAEEELRYLAHHDPLTKLPNRALFYDRLISGLSVAHHYQSNLALLFLDINDFKDINDVHGHAAGDRVLCTTAGRLCTRSRHGGPDGRR